VAVAVAPVAVELYVALPSNRVPEKSEVNETAVAVGGVKLSGVAVSVMVSTPPPASAKAFSVACDVMMSPGLESPGNGGASALPLTWKFPTMVRGTTTLPGVKVSVNDTVVVPSLRVSVIRA